MESLRLNCSLLLPSNDCVNSGRNRSLIAQRTSNRGSPKDSNVKLEQKVEDMLFVKVPLPLQLQENALSQRSNRACNGQSNKGLPNADCLIQKTSATNRLLQRLASKKPSRAHLAFVAPEVIPSTTQLYEHVKHQLSRKGDVKLPSYRQGNELSPNETVEVVSAIVLSFHRNILSTPARP